MSTDDNYYFLSNFTSYYFVFSIFDNIVLIVDKKFSYSIVRLLYPKFYRIESNTPWLNKLKLFIWSKII